MAPQSSTLAWEVPWMEELGGLRSMGSQMSWAQLSDSNNYTLSVAAPQGSPLGCLLSCPFTWAIPAAMASFTSHLSHMLPLKYLFLA